MSLLTDEDIQSLEQFESEARQMSGWLLDYAPKELGTGPSWDYDRELLALMSCSETRMLDIGTGGGEKLDALLRESKPHANVFATEEYVINAPVASQNLNSSASVVRASGEILPFGAASFDLVFSRHTAVQPQEIARVLNAGGVFLTQQVTSDYLIELKEFFRDFTIYPNHFERYKTGLEQSGMEIVEAKEYKTLCRFESFGHLVYMLAVAPWLMPNFGVHSHLVQLNQLYQATDSGRELEFTCGYHMIRARKS